MLKITKNEANFQVRSTKIYRATFNNGALEETFYAADDDHASRVAHEIAARNQITFDAVQLAAEKTEDGGNIYPRAGVADVGFETDVIGREVELEVERNWPEPRCT